MSIWKKSKARQWSEVKARLNTHDMHELVALIRDLYRENGTNQRFLHARLFMGEKEKEEYRHLILEAAYPDPLGHRRIDVAEARRLIHQYQRATSDVSGTVDLMLSCIEAGTEQALDLGVEDEGYFIALESICDAIVEKLEKLPPESRQTVADRFRETLKRATSLSKAASARGSLRSGPCRGVLARTLWSSSITKQSKSPRVSNTRHPRRENRVQ